MRVRDSRELPQQQPDTTRSRFNQISRLVLLGAFASEPFQSLERTTERQPLLSSSSARHWGEPRLSLIGRLCCSITATVMRLSASELVLVQISHHASSSLIRVLIEWALPLMLVASECPFAYQLEFGVVVFGMAPPRVNKRSPTCLSL